MRLPDAAWDWIAELLDVWEEANAAGRDIPAEDLCRDCPELLPQVTAGIAALRRLAAARGTKEPGAARADSLQYQPGEIIDGRFQLEREIARGGSAVIWQCRMDFGTRKVAVKLPHSPHPNPEKDITEVFLREGERVRLLFHPNIVPVYSHGRHGRVAYIAFKLVEGETLRNRIRRIGQHPLTSTEVRSIAWQMAYALAYAHGQNLIHRDLKPENVLLQPDGRVYLTDFGIALTHGEVASGAAGWTGTEGYMAPEQVRGESLGPTCDVYAFGVILYELLTGSRPPVPLPSFRDSALAGISPSFRLVLQKCLATHPDDRYASGDQLLLALRPGAPARRVAMSSPVEARPVPAVSDPNRAPTAGQSNAKTRRLLFAALTVIPSVLLAFVAGSTLIGAGRDVPPLSTTIAVVTGCIGAGFVLVRPQRMALGLVSVLVLGLVLAAVLGNAADSLLRSATHVLNKSIRVP